MRIDDVEVINDFKTGRNERLCLNLGVINDDVIRLRGVIDQPSCLNAVLMAID
ncbi:hypothetical protein Fmac_008671 [Flemingia macrophylla]|uniref:Uncharacterized protein n=1 Tax=Flemingia macrophylla TaxID=520843 RepID=A0ABD1MY25_9FABA